MGEKFKVGDLVEVTATKDEMYRKNSYNGTLTKGDRARVILVQSEWDAVQLEPDRGGRAVNILFKFIKPAPMSRPHADMIIQWAQDSSLEVECSTDGDNWAFVTNPAWLPKMQYRFKSTKRTKLESELKAAEEKVQKIKEELKNLG